MFNLDSLPIKREDILDHNLEVMPYRSLQRIASILDLPAKIKRDDVINLIRAVRDGRFDIIESYYIVSSKPWLFSTRNEYQHQHPQQQNLQIQQSQRYSRSEDFPTAYHPVYQHHASQYCPVFPSSLNIQHPTHRSIHYSQHFPQTYNKTSFISDCILALQLENQNQIRRERQKDTSIVGKARRIIENESSESVTNEDNFIHTTNRICDASISNSNNVERTKTASPNSSHDANNPINENRKTSKRKREVSTVVNMERSQRVIGAESSEVIVIEDDDDMVNIKCNNSISNRKSDEVIERSSMNTNHDANISRNDVKSGPTRKSQRTTRNQHLPQMGSPKLTNNKKYKTRSLTKSTNSNVALPYESCSFSRIQSPAKKIKLNNGRNLGEGNGIPSSETPNTTNINERKIEEEIEQSLSSPRSDAIPTRDGLVFPHHTPQYEPLLHPTLNIKYPKNQSIEVLQNFVQLLNSNELSMFYSNTNLQINRNVNQWKKHRDTWIINIDKIGAIEDDLLIADDAIDETNLHCEMTSHSMSKTHVNLRSGSQKKNSETNKQFNKEVQIKKQRTPKNKSMTQKHLKPANKKSSSVKTSSIVHSIVSNAATESLSSTIQTSTKINNVRNKRETRCREKMFESSKALSVNNNGIEHVKKAPTLSLRESLNSKPDEGRYIQLVNCPKIDCKVCLPLCNLEKHIKTNHAAELCYSFDCETQFTVSDFWKCKKKVLIQSISNRIFVTTMDFRHGLLYVTVQYLPEGRKTRSAAIVRFKKQSDVIRTWEGKVPIFDDVNFQLQRFSMILNLKNYCESEQLSIRTMVFNL